ncbi:glycosyltransferase family protein [Chamaesiphon minutus]|uniref:Putative glycosyl transferase n=1 Tax=Chamaesiphon minutus (strain ATCC 27169 / PCC 6605) TaxID=1173020 RepID=K9UFT9_CHAP6|nr:glycosyltransferase [Chamaesiphon minutus]AFY93528.1 putative glycosyl transferase [Chamaesiphon minutus PCC 6605]
MKKILFYCQNLLGMGHLVRTTELMRELVKTFEVCLIEGGQKVAGFEMLPEVEVIQLPTIQVEVFDSLQVGKQLQVVGSTMSLEEVKEFRQQKLIEVFDRFQPDVLITEGYPFSKNKALAFEMVPLLEHVRKSDRTTQAICSLRDIIMVKEFADRDAEEKRRCEFVNQYYDAILLHSDPAIHRLEDNISTAGSLTCPVYYTGYVVQSEPDRVEFDLTDSELLKDPIPKIVVSVGGGKLGHDLLESIIQAAPLIHQQIYHQIVIFAGPLMDEAKYRQLEKLAQGKTNVNLRRFTPSLIAYLDRADLSISLGGYNTTMNILKTGVKSMIYPSDKDREQAIRAEKLERLGLLKILDKSELDPELLARSIVNYLADDATLNFEHLIQLDGAEKASIILQNLLEFNAKSVTPTIEIVASGAKSPYAD